MAQRTVRVVLLVAQAWLTTAMVARPALRLGGEWAGHRVAFSHRGELQPVPEQYVPDEMIEWGQAPSGFEELTTESWSGVGSALSRRSVRLLPEDAIP